MLAIRCLQTFSVVNHVLRLIKSLVALLTPKSMLAITFCKHSGAQDALQMPLSLSGTPNLCRQIVVRKYKTRQF
uniref:Putative secreted protein n=1 Tax=Xenopsylla cheopis TaxID=163159 RepID=A0A6M2E0L9_XENCH